MSDYKFEGWVGLDKSAAKGQMVWQEFEPKAWEETDVDIKVSCCGICGSDLHTLRSGWVSIPPPQRVDLLAYANDDRAPPHTPAASAMKSSAQLCASDRKLKET